MVQVGQIYRHYKGTPYQILAVATAVEELVSTMPQVVAYQDMTAPEKIWARELNEFTGMVEWQGKTVKRFVLVSEADKA